MDSALSRAGAEHFHRADHDHDHCIDTALQEATVRCAARGARLTALRARVLEIVWQSHRPLGAYGILEVLHQDGRRAAPPTVYRALEFLLEHGLVHRIASLNAFIGCPHPGHPGTGQFLICGHCGSVAELDDADVEGAIGRGAGTLGFQVHHHTVEVTGLCPLCQDRRRHDP